MGNYTPEPVVRATKPYKAIVAGVIAVAIVLTQVIMTQIADGKWTLEDTLVSILAFLGTVGVYAKENPPA